MKLVITESEKNNIRKMYDLIKENNNQSQLNKLTEILNKFKDEIMKYNGKTVKMYDKQISSKDDDQLKKQSYKGVITIDIGNIHHTFQNDFKEVNLDDLISAFKGDDKKLQEVKSALCSNNSYGIPKLTKGAISTVDLGFFDGEKLTMTLDTTSINEPILVTFKTPTIKFLDNENFRLSITPLGLILKPIIDLTCELKFTNPLPQTDFRK